MFLAGGAPPAIEGGRAFTVAENANVGTVLKPLTVGGELRWSDAEGDVPSVVIVADDDFEHEDDYTKFTVTRSG